MEELLCETGKLIKKWHTLRCLNSVQKNTVRRLCVELSGSECRCGGDKKGAIGNNENSFVLTILYRN